MHAKDEDAYAAIPEDVMNQKKEEIRRTAYLIPVQTWPMGSRSGCTAASAG
jgi:hypothetical protein